MTKKKKIILFTLLSITIIMTSYWYSLWSAKKEREKVVKWVEENGGIATYSNYPEWLYKLPGFIQERAKRDKELRDRANKLKKEMEALKELRQK